MLLKGFLLTVRDLLSCHLNFSKKFLCIIMVFSYFLHSWILHYILTRDMTYNNSQNFFPIRFVFRYQVMPRFLLKHCHGMLTQPLITMPDLKAFHWITRTAVLNLPRVLAAWGAVGSAASACMPSMGQRQLHSRSFQGKFSLLSS